MYSITSKTLSSRQAGDSPPNSRSASSFWRNRPSNSRQGSGKSYDPNVVVGASYSHADMLKFDSLYDFLAMSHTQDTDQCSKGSGLKYLQTADTTIVLSQ